MTENDGHKAMNDLLRNAAGRGVVNGARSDHADQLTTAMRDFREAIAAGDEFAAARHDAHIEQLLQAGREAQHEGFDGGVQGRRPAPLPGGHWQPQTSADLFRAAIAQAGVERAERNES